MSSATLIISLVMTTVLLLIPGGNIVVVEGLSINYRKGIKSDELQIGSTLMKELMNPIGIQSENFMVATTTSDDPFSSNNDIVGWAQIRPLGGSGDDTKAQRRDPNRFDAKPGSYDLEQDIDDQMWDEFIEDDSIQVPTGFASLPWTKEYRGMNKGVQKRQQRREQLRQKEELMMKESQQEQLYELASVYVKPKYRGQGIGTELVQRVLQQHIYDGQQKALPPCNIYCLTLSTTTSWYQKNFGFEITKDIPASMTMEVMAGNMLTKLMGTELCCLQATLKTLELCRS